MTLSSIEALRKSFVHSVQPRATHKFVYQTTTAAHALKQLAKARNFGLSQQRNLCMPVHDPVFDDINELDSDDSEDEHDDPDYTTWSWDEMWTWKHVTHF